MLLCCYLIVTFSRFDPCWGQFKGVKYPLSIGMIPARPCDILDLPNIIDAGVPAHTSSPLATICTLPPTSTLIPSLSLAACKYRSEGRSIS